MILDKYTYLNFMINDSANAQHNHIINLFIHTEIQIF